GSNRFLSAPVEAAKAVSRQLYQDRFLTVVASFALGYLAAVLFHGRINAPFGRHQEGCSSRSGGWVPMSDEIEVRRRAPRYTHNPLQDGRSERGTDFTVTRQLCRSGAARTVWENLSMTFLTASSWETT